MKLPRLLIEAEDAEIAANQNTRIETFVANAPVIVSGEATIQNATINTGGVFFNLNLLGCWLRLEFLPPLTRSLYQLRKKSSFLQT